MDWSAFLHGSLRAGWPAQFLPIAPQKYLAHTRSMEEPVTAWSCSTDGAQLEFPRNWSPAGRIWKWEAWGLSSVYSLFCVLSQNSSLCCPFSFYLSSILSCFLISSQLSLAFHFFGWMSAMAEAWTTLGIWPWGLLSTKRVYLITQLLCAIYDPRYKVVGFSPNKWLCEDSKADVTVWFRVSTSLPGCCTSWR